MTLLLAIDPMVLKDTRTVVDEHGWMDEAAPGTTVWSGLGNLQEESPEADPLAQDGGGDGPYAPSHQRVGQAYVPESVGAEPGMLLVARGLTWVVQRVRPMPSPALGLDVIVLEVMERREVT